MHGTVLWFNEAKDHGFISTEAGERLYVHGSAFVDGKEALAGRCKGLPVSFEVALSDDGRSATGVSVMPPVASGRARLRSRARPGVR